MKSWILDIAELPPSANTYLRMHYRKRNDLLGRWKFNIRNKATELEIPQLEWVDISIVLYFQDRRRRDQDNFTFTAYKLVLDSLKKNRYDESWPGVIPDDSPEYVTMHPVILALDRHSPRTSVLLTGT